MVKALFERLETIPEPAILLVNAGLGGFVLLAHGGALLLVLSGKVPAPPGYADLVRTMVPFTLPIAGLVLTGSAIGMVWPTARRVVLPLQAIILVLSGVALLIWAGGIVIHGIPAGNLAWAPGFLTGWVAYSGFLCGRFVFRAAWRQHPAIRYIAVIAAAVALPVDVGVFLRFLAKMSHV